MLETSLLGNISLRLRGKPITHFRSQKELALLVFLAHTGQTHNRETLADLLWDARSTEQSLSNLRTALSRLRKHVGEYLVVTRKTVAVTPAVHEQTDSVQFQTMLTGVGKDGSATAVSFLTQALALYSGEFMADFSLANAPRFNDWLLVEQERFRQLAMHGYRQLASWQEKQGAFAAGAMTAQQWVTWDPLDETAQQQLMRLLAFDGRIAEALATYEKCSHLMQTELGVAPAPATTALYEAIQKGALPPPTLVPAPLHNLPRALTPLFGRKTELATLTDYLTNPEYPLVCIIGVGGMGKTSLALAAGRQLQAQEQPPFTDGIWFVSLEEIEKGAPQRIREEVATLVGQAMGLIFHSEGNLWPQLLGRLAEKNLLLILDTIEQFLTVAADLILELLAASDNIHLLTTSRTTLPLAASFAFPLGGLETPTEASAEALQNDSVRLFAERAARTPAPFQLENHLPTVVAICQFVEGMPLGIEMATASSGRLMIHEIMPAITSNLRLLNTTRRDLPARQRTLQAVFDYTWRLLSPSEQNLLAQVSIFHGGFTLLAAEAVLNEELTDLYSLQDHALLNRNETGRFRMHPVLRQLAREKLNDPERTALAEETLRRHSLYFAHFIQSFEEKLQRGVGQLVLGAILPEQANLRAAWQHAMQAGQWQTIADSLNGVHCFYKRKGLFNEEAAQVDAAIVALQGATAVDDGFAANLLNRLLIVRAWGYLYAAQFEKGVDTAVRACNLAQQLENPANEAHARLIWARILARQNQHEPALTQFEQVVALAQTSQNQMLEADGWIGIGSQKLWRADVSLAREPLIHALALCQALQYKLGEMETLTFLGTLAYRQESFALSLDYHQRALRLSRLLGAVIAEAESLGSVGVCLTSQGDLSLAQMYYAQALAIFSRLIMPESEQWILGQMGYTAVQLGDYNSAEENLSAALASARQLKDLFWQAWITLRLSEMWQEQGKSDMALAYVVDAFETAVQIQNPRFQAAILYGWGNALLGKADWAGAEQKFQQAYELKQQAGQIEQATPALAGLAYATYQQGKQEAAAIHAEQVWQAWQTAPPWAERANLKLYWRLSRVWQGSNDSRYNDLQDQALALLETRSKNISNEAARQKFLEQVPANRALLRQVAELPLTAKTLRNEN